MTIVRGEFDVTTVPQPPEADANFAAVSRLLLDKRYHGPLSALARGQMLAIGGEAGWGVYVAMEKVEGTLDGKRGSFILYHHGTMTPQQGQQMVVAVAPGSGTDDLAGLSGRLTIEITGDGHFYVFEYSLG